MCAGAATPFRGIYSTRVASQKQSLASKAISVLAVWAIVVKNARTRLVCKGSVSRGSAHVPNSGRRLESCDWSRWMIDECICETRDSLRSSVAPISFIVNSS